MVHLTLRAAAPVDADTIKQLAVDNHMFEPDELGDFDEMLTGFFAGTLDDHHWIVVEAAARSDGGDGDDGVAGPIVGAAYYAPEPFSDRMWNLYFIATDPDRHGSGIGSRLLDAVEAALVARGSAAARTLIVDTSSLDDYDQARAFYAARGFVEEARLRDFYGPGDHKVTFWKRLGQ